MEILDKLEVKDYLQDIEQHVEELENILDVNFETKFRNYEKIISLKFQTKSGNIKYVNLNLGKKNYESDLSLQNSLKNGTSLKLAYSFIVEWDKKEKNYVILENELTKFIKRMNRLGYSIVIFNTYGLLDKQIHESTIPNNIEKSFQFIKQENKLRSTDTESKILNIIKKNPNIKFSEIDEKMPLLKPWQYPITFNDKKISLDVLIENGMIEKVGRGYVFKKDFTTEYYWFSINIIHNFDLEDLENINLDEIPEDLVLKYNEFVKKWNANVDMKKDLIDIIKSSNK